MRIAALSLGPDTHLDHLGVLAEILNIPLIVADSTIFELAKTLYPFSNLEFKDPLELSLEYLSKNYDVILGCCKFWALELFPLLETLYQKKMRFVFCPHGNSDKGYSLNYNEITQDISFFYGPHMWDHLKKTHSHSSHLIRTGNYRYPFYLKHRSFFDELAHQKVFSYFNQQKKIILYAPTWNDGENVSSFFTCCDTLIEQISPFYHLIIKLHPLLEEYNPAETIYRQAKHEKNPAVIFLKEFPLIYPLLNRCDIYIGDFSSIGYDFLVFDKPIYFLTDPPASQHSSLCKAGMLIPTSTKIGDFLKKTEKTNQKEFSKIRKSLYQYTFGSERPGNEIKNELLKILSEKKKPCP